MTWHGAAGFFAMGGYGLYVWGAYAVTAACLLAEPAIVAVRHAQARRALVVAAREGSS